MGYAVNWLYPPRLVLIQYLDKVVKDDILNQTETLAQVLDESGQAPVHLIVDLSDVVEIGLGLSDLKSVATKAHDSVGWMAVIAPNPVFRFFASIGIQISRGKYRVFANRADALKFLIEQDQSLRKVIPES